jgi:hypothetical protein
MIRRHRISAVDCVEYRWRSIGVRAFGIGMGVEATVDPSTPATGRLAKTRKAEFRPHHPQAIHGMVANG